ncbi:fumarylacetoacetate hydrolase family protein [Streptomyces sp. AcE210]|uniref:fumarylacetoacetate hydrolase family protein n=1 Tax=Streptomyces sp. AcE210 TaxID=2292703 RepID=UPI000E309954|nr:fumarylacetoacetate hydrolase family protein [Streptomyces sp. AcE210]RFC75064.1 FAA hydrolase family protein [Streptomyces sp. AcE210]
MRIARIGRPGHEIPVVLDDDRVLDLRGVTPDVTPEFLEHVLPTLDPAGLPELDDTAGLRVGPPITRPTAVICVGMNYAKHAAESGAEPPTEPVVFLKHPNTVVGPDDPVTIPRGSTMTDWEVELGVVIGRRAGYLDSPADARDHIAGYVLANDVSERELQLHTSGGQWSKGKCAPTFTPVGPWLVTPDEVDPGSVRLRSRVNGEARQNSSTADLILSVPEVVYRLSQFMTLEPGDLILTGTPEGVALSGRFPYLSAGDVVELEGAGLGRQRQVMVAEGRR